MSGGSNPNGLILEAFSQRNVATSVCAQGGALLLLAVLPSKKRVRFSVGAPNCKGYLLIGQVHFGLNITDLKVPMRAFERGLKRFGGNIILREGALVWEIARQLQLVADAAPAAWGMYGKFAEDFGFVQQNIGIIRETVAA